MARVLVAGAGYVGTATGQRLAARGDDVYLLRRQVACGQSRMIRADLTQPSSLRVVPRDLTHLVYCAGPDGRSDEQYEAALVSGLSNLLAEVLRPGHQIRRVLLTSSTAVYAQRDGDWVDEDSPTRPDHFTGKRVLEAERILRDSPCSGVILRLGGIYGPGRTRLVSSVLRGEVPGARAAWTNRIHRDDCAAAIEHLLYMRDAQSVYLGVDSEPVERGVLVEWIADRLGVPAPAAAAVSSGRPATNKRCSNARLLSAGFELRYPSYREGYAALLDSRRMAPPESGCPSH